MRASKEACREALKVFTALEQACKDAECDLGPAVTEEKFNQVREFLACAEKRLPSESALDKDKVRRRKK